MARYNEQAKILAGIIRDKNKLKAQISRPTNKISIVKFYTNVMQVTPHNFVAKTRAVTATQTWGITTWDGGTWSATHKAAAVEIVRRRWEWLNETQLSAGTYDGNIDIANGDIRIA